MLCPHHVTDADEIHGLPITSHIPPNSGWYMVPQATLHSNSIRNKNNPGYYHRHIWSQCGARANSGVRWIILSWQTTIVICHMPTKWLQADPMTTRSWALHSWHQMWRSVMPFSQKWMWHVSVSRKCHAPKLAHDQSRISHNSNTVTVKVPSPELVQK